MTNPLDPPSDPHGRAAPDVPEPWEEEVPREPDEADCDDEQDVCGRFWSPE